MICDVDIRKKDSVSFCTPSIWCHCNDRKLLFFFFFPTGGICKYGYLINMHASKWKLQNCSFIHMFLIHLTYAKDIFCNRMTFQCIFKSPLYHTVSCHEKKMDLGGKVLLDWFLLWFAIQDWPIYFKMCASC